MSCCQHLIRSYGLDEITKFVGVSSNHSLLNPKRVALWTMSNDSQASSIYSTREKSLLSYLLLYGIGCKPPLLVIDREKRDASIAIVNLHSKDLCDFLDKFFMVYNKNIRKKILLNMFFYSNYCRMRVDDLALFVDLSHVVSFFQSLDEIFIDIHVSYFKEYQFVYFLDVLNRSSS